MWCYRVPPGWDFPVVEGGNWCLGVDQRGVHRSGFRLFRGAWWRRTTRVVVRLPIELERERTHVMIP